MKRKIWAALLIGVFAVSGAFATGQSETWGEQQLGEETTIEGRFTVLDGFPAIETPEGTYTLGAPRAAWVASTIEEGTEIEVKGYLIDDPRGPRGHSAAPEGVGHLRVTEATIDGESYEVAPPGTGPGVMGRPGAMGRPGVMGGPGWGHHGHMGPRGSLQPHSRGGAMGGPRGPYDGGSDQGGYRRRR